MLTRIDCKCGKSHVEIDDNNMILVCGVIGLVGWSNVHVFGGVITCAERNCGNEVYRQKKDS